MTASLSLLNAKFGIPTRWLVRRERQKRGVASALYRTRKHSLMRSAGTRYSPGQNLAAFRNKPRQHSRVLVIDIVNFIRAELARLTCANEASAPTLAAAAIVAASLVPGVAAHNSSSSSSDSSLPIGRTGSA